MPRTFPARYDGECNECGLEFWAGDDIGYVDDEIACADCVHSGPDSEDA